MTSKNIIIVGAVAIGIYLLSQAKKIPFITGAQRSPPAIIQTARQKITQKVAPKRIGQPTTRAAYIAALRKAARIAAVRKAAAQKIGKKIGKTVAQKVVQKKTGQPTTQAARIAAALRKAAAQRAWIERARKIRIRKAAAKKIGKKIGKTVAQKVVQKKTGQPTTQAVYIAAQRKAAPWKAPYKFPKSNFRVITPSDKLRNLAKKDIARKKAVQQKKVQKTTPSTPSARRKKRLEALYGSHWHDIWVQRQRR